MMPVRGENKSPPRHLQRQRPPPQFGYSAPRGTEPVVVAKIVSAKRCCQGVVGRYWLASPMISLELRGNQPVSLRFDWSEFDRGRVGDGSSARLCREAGQE